MIPSAGAFSASGSIQKHSSHSRLGGGRRVGIRASCVRIQKTSVPIQALTDAKLLAWERKGHTVIRDLLPKAQLDTIQQEMQEVVQHRTLEALRHRWVSCGSCGSDGPEAAVDVSGPCVVWILHSLTSPHQSCRTFGCCQQAVRSSPFSASAVKNQH